MAVAMYRQFAALLPELRWQPTVKRVRVLLAGEVIADTVAAPAGLGTKKGRAVLRGAGTRHHRRAGSTR